MNRLRNIAQWLWRTKERLVLGIMVVVLAFQIFSVTRAGDEGEGGAAMPRDPGKVTDPAKLNPQPPGDPEEPDIFIPDNRTPDVTNDPFVWRPEESSGGGGDDEVELYLLAIRGAGDNYRVQIRSESSRKWYSVGSSFENYEILSVDPEEGTCEIFDESRNRTRTLYLED